MAENDGNFDKEKVASELSRFIEESKNLADEFRLLLYSIHEYRQSNGK